jgi:hypothetical protein
MRDCGDILLETVHSAALGAFICGCETKTALLHCVHEGTHHLSSLTMNAGVHPPMMNRSREMDHEGRPYRFGTNVPCCDNHDES